MTMGSYLALPELSDCGDQRGNMAPTYHVAEEPLGLLRPQARVRLCPQHPLKPCPWILDVTDVRKERKVESRPFFCLVAAHFLTMENVLRGDFFRASSLYRRC